MSKFSPFPHDQGFALAEAFLAGGRNKVNRPVASNTRLRRVNDDTIALVLHNTAVVTYHRDTTMTIYGGGWNTVTTKQRIGQFSPCNVHSEKGAWVVGYTGDHTPAKIHKCRSCKQRGTWMENDYCNGPSYWGPDYCNGATTGYRLPIGAEDWHKSYYVEPCEHGKMERHATKPCAHDQWSRHTTGQSERTCYRCNGTGKADYGSKRIPILAGAGQPYRVDAQGVFMHLEDNKPSNGSYGYYPSSTPWKVPTPAYNPHDMGAETASRLAGVIPGLHADVKHPVTQSLMSVSRTIISLNDTHHWTRERIADWLDTLDTDLRFPVPA